MKKLLWIFSVLIILFFTGCMGATKKMDGTFSEGSILILDKMVSKEHASELPSAKIDSAKDLDSTPQLILRLVTPSNEANLTHTEEMVIGIPRNQIHLNWIPLENCQAIYRILKANTKDSIFTSTKIEGEVHVDRKLKTIILGNLSMYAKDPTVDFHNLNEVQRRFQFILEEN